MDSDKHRHTNSSTKPVEACVICLSPVSERAIVVPCNHHSFDFLCLASWLQETPRCPLCNTTLSAVQYDWRAPDDFKTYQVPVPQPSASATPSSNGGNRRLAWHNTPNRYRHPQRGQARRPVWPNIPLRNPTLRPTPYLETTSSLSTAVSRRRHIYRHNLYSLHVGSNRVSKYRDFTASTFVSSTMLQTRAQKWLRRELQAFDFLSDASATTSTPPNPTLASSSTAQSTAQAPRPNANANANANNNDTSKRKANNTEFLLSYIIAILKTVDIKGSSGKAEEMLGEFLGLENARLFLHELNAWLRSPYERIEDWDRWVQYTDGGNGGESREGRWRRNDGVGAIGSGEQK